MTKTNNSPVSDLAIFGGTPQFKEPMPVGLPNIGDRDQFFNYVNDIFDRRRLTNNGPYVRELERRLANLFDVRHCILVNNGTAGLLFALKGLGLDGEIIVPSFTFVATAHVIEWLGLKPIFCDVDPNTHNLDPNSVERLITPQTSAILGVHLWGQIAQVERLAEIADEHNLKLILDASHAFCSKKEGRYSGGFGNVEVFSLHATKFFNTLEGGAVTTNDSELAEIIRLQRNFGFKGEDNVISLGINGKLNEISAAMGLNLLNDLPDLLSRLRRNYRLYAESLDGIQGLRLLDYPDPNNNNCQYIVLEVDNQVIKRDHVQAILSSENVLARRYFNPGCHRMEPYVSKYDPDRWALPVTERLVKQILVLPNNAVMDTADVERIAELVRFVFAKSQEINERTVDK